MRFALLLVCASVAAASLAQHPYAGDKEVFGRLLSTGKVFSEKNSMGSWAPHGYAMPHEMLRRELHVTERALKHIDPSKDWHRTAFFTYWSFVVPVVHGHHWAEEEIIFPAIIAKTGQDLPPQVST
jgi:hypothetical protein